MEPRLPETIGRRATDAFLALFEPLGWEVAKIEGPDDGPDLQLTNKFGHTYHAVVKASNEGRADRVTALFAQALLEARAHAKENQTRPAVLIWVGSVTPSLLNRLHQFHQRNGDEEPYAVLSPEGLRDIHFPGFTNAQRVAVSSASRHDFAARPRLVFSDRTQWMLKLLLASDLSREDLINAPRQHYATATDLARTAGVSVMTATRLVHALKEEGFIETKPVLQLVQRRKLALRWKAAQLTPATSVGMKFVAPGATETQLRKLLHKESGILGYFAAASALGVGHVHGVPPYFYTQSLVDAAGWRPVRPAREGERADVIVLQSSCPQSLQRGAVLRDGMRVTDIIQTWLDVSAHPARGAEQAAELEHGILANVIGERA